MSQSLHKLCSLTGFAALSLCLGMIAGDRSANAETFNFSTPGDSGYFGPIAPASGTFDATSTPSTIDLTEVSTNGRYGDGSSFLDLTIDGQEKELINYNLATYIFSERLLEGNTYLSSVTYDVDGGSLLLTNLGGIGKLENANATDTLSYAYTATATFTPNAAPTPETGTLASFGALMTAGVGALIIKRKRSAERS